VNVTLRPRLQNSALLAKTDVGGWESGESGASNCVKSTVALLNTFSRDERRSF
jgi:hypothetical protein